MNSRFFTIETEARQQFYQVPKAFMCKDSKYFSMSAMAKLLYGILADRNSLSMKNGWFDEENRIYFKFNQEELCDVLGVKDPKTLRKYLKELEKHELLFRKRMGAMLVDRLYLLQVESSETLINSMMGKISPSRQGNFPHHDRENFPPSYTNINNTNSISSSS
ncbi:MAG: replication initiator protein A, partial [Clostridia bacterium]|nr:replication initiator protein A [Clostridia bacterium]